ncbi:MAG: CDP-alcohol phosphatidyltransferase family protein [Deltaproteobacteria bacterium]|nr:CDP-alcohol phosphatidyltransferase family protein [Deltaproteobacteria bacterium]
MSVPLRLVLSAQRCGAAAVHLARDAEALAPALIDRRVTIPIRTGAPPPEVVTIEVPADVVVHADAFRALADAVADGRARVFGHGDAKVVARAAAATRTSHGPPVPLVFAHAFAFPPMRVATLRDAVRANGALLRACRKPTDGWTSRYLNRNVSLTLTRLLIHLGLRPNHISLAIVAIGVASGVVAARGTHDGFVLGAALLQVQSTLDGCDGEVARMTHRQSRLGEWLDTIGDDLSNYAFFAGASFGMHRATNSVAWLWVGAVIVGCGGLASAIEYRYLARVGSGDLLVYPIVGGPPRHPVARVAAGLQPLFKRDTFILLTFLAAAAGALSAALIASAVGAVAILITVMRTEARLARSDTPSERR